ncbi:MAG: cytochrome c3 family protein, partial [Bacteroidota bacterium]
STLTPSVSQTISASGTYYFRAYDGTTCWGPDGSALVTITTVPTTVTVSGGGTFCGSTTLTANGGTGGTIYWQNTTSGGTSTATPSSSQVVSASGTYYFRALNGTCWGPEGSATVVINTLPTAVTVTGGGTFCSVPNVTLNASGGTGGTIYWQNTTTNGTSTATPSISQTVSSSGTYYFRAQTAAGCWGTQGSATVTMGTTPTAVTVSGGGTFCGTSATLTASGGVGGTMYWQNTTSNGTSTASPSSSQTVVASGTYYFRALNGTCWSTQGSATVTINPVPTITLGTNPSVCSGTTSTNLTYSATAGTPNQYSIVYDAAALAQGFVNVTNAALPLSPIALLVPASAAAGIYNLTVTVRNSTTGCVSNNYAKTVTIIAIPATPGIISGSTNPAPGTTGLVYSISPVSGATSYIWSVPTGWTITAGGGSTSITVTSGVGGQNGNITVQATNSCSTSAASSLSVAVAVPHNNCNQCHINHNSYGTALAIVSGNANLCISCHNTSGTASANPFSNAMKAVPGTSGTSHTWDATAVNYKDGANLPTDAGMLARMDGGKILCSTCHNQHSNTFSPFLRVSNDGDAMCKQCHSVRNVGRYIDNPSVNIGSHPVGVTYNGLDARFLSTPSSSTPLVNAKVECSSCHKTHYAASSDGYALRMTYTDAICKSCHVWKSSRRSLDHEGMGCITCHIAHKAGNTNIMLVRDTISTPNSGFKAVVFSANSSASNYADATSPFNGVCEACHTLTSHYTNNSGGTSDARHVPATQKCTTCHPHDDAFYPQTNCLDCHKNVVGTRRQIVDANGDGSGTGGDFKRTSHHVTGSVPNVSDCILCHYMGDHKSGTVKLMDPDLGYLNVITYNPADKSTLEPFCIKCHDADGAGGDQTPFSDNVTVPVIDQTMWNASAHKGNANTNTCLSCHDNGHGSNKSTLIGPADYTGPGTGTDLMNEEEGFCLGCHGGTGVASVKVHLAFSSYTNTATRFFKHDPTATYRKHNNGENTGAAFGGTNRHVECVDCHNPHGAKAYAATTAPTIYNELIGASGVTPAYAGIGAPTGFTFNKNTTYEYEVCYKCHSSYTTLPTYLPDGIINGTTPTYQTDGLRKLTTSTNSQVPDWRDMARVFNPANLGYHPVMAAGKNTTLNVNTLQTGWTASSRMYCTSCHDNNNNGAGYGRGPHGSSNLHILDGTTNYTTAHGAAPTQTMNCINCHKVTSYITSNTNSGFGYHTTHYSQNATCYLCHNSHGGEIIHMINFSRNENVSCITAMTGTSQTAFTHATGGYN